MANQSETEVHALEAFKDEIRSHQKRRETTDGTLPHVVVENLSSDQMAVWEDYKKLLKMIDAELLTDFTRSLDPLVVEAKRLSQIIQQKRHAVGDGEFWAWLANKVGALTSIDEDLSSTMDALLLDKSEFCL